MYVKCVHLYICVHTCVRACVAVCARACLGARVCVCTCVFFIPSPQWGAADAEIKVPSGKKTELKRPPFKAWSRSVYSHTCYAYCQGCLTLPVHSPAFFPKPLPIFPVLVVANTCLLCRPENKIGQPAGGRFPCRVPAEYK